MQNNTQNNVISETAQKRFNDRYITSSEIGSELAVTRPSILYARRRGILPDGISVGANGVYIWEREVIRPYVDSWKLILKARRGSLA